nr:MAG TPA: hypothetical protein [Caudoviricetes sp.]
MLFRHIVPIYNATIESASFQFPFRFCSSVTDSHRKTEGRT